MCNEELIAFDSQICYRFWPVGGAIREISDQVSIAHASTPNFALNALIDEITHIPIRL